MRRSIRLAGALALTTLATVALSPASHASAAVIGSCRVSVPSQIRISGPYQHVTAKLDGGCALPDRVGNTGAAWTGYTSSGASEFLYFDGAASDDLDLYDWNTTLGVMSWRPEGAYERVNYDEYTQNAPKTEIRLGSWTALKASRSGSKVTFSGNGVRYSATYQQNLPWETVATISYRNVGSSTWVNLKSLKVRGSFTWTTTSSRARDYRVYYAGTPQIWPSTSGTVRK